MEPLLLFHHNQEFSHSLNLFNFVLLPFGQILGEFDPLAVLNLISSLLCLRNPLLLAYRKSSLVYIIVSGENRKSKFIF